MYNKNESNNIVIFYTLRKFSTDLGSSPHHVNLQFGQHTRLAQ